MQNDYSLGPEDILPYLAKESEPKPEKNIVTIGPYSIPYSDIRPFIKFLHALQKKVYNGHLDQTIPMKDLETRSYGQINPLVETDRLGAAEDLVAFYVKDIERDDGSSALEHAIKTTKIGLIPQKLNSFHLDLFQYRSLLKDLWKTYELKKSTTGLGILSGYPRSFLGPDDSLVISNLGYAVDDLKTIITDEAIGKIFHDLVEEVRQMAGEKALPPLLELMTAISPQATLDALLNTEPTLDEVSSVRRRITNGLVSPIGEHPTEKIYQHLYNVLIKDVVDTYQEGFVPDFPSGRYIGQAATKEDAMILDMLKRFYHLDRKGVKYEKEAVKLLRPIQVLLYLQGKGGVGPALTLHADTIQNLTTPRDAENSQRRLVDKAIELYRQTDRQYLHHLKPYYDAVIRDLLADDDSVLFGENIDKLAKLPIDQRALRVDRISRIFRKIRGYQANTDPNMLISVLS